MSNTTIKPLGVFKSACGFRKAAKLLKETYKKGEYDLLNPCNVNLAFAAELFIKCLLYLNAASVPKHHELKELFRNLSKIHRQRINKLFMEEVKKKPYIARIEAIEPSFKFEINEVLEASNDSFKEWRYIFEEREQTVQFYGVEEFVDALHTYIQTVKSEWSRYA